MSKLPKIAALISGEPRFCEEFTVQLSRLKNFQLVDWYILLWTDNQDSLHRLLGNQLVSPFWKTTNSTQAFLKITENLPPGHIVKKLQCVDKHSVALSIKDINCPEDAHAPSAWWMFKSLLMAYNMIPQPLDYDLIFRTRPDISVDPFVDFQSVWHELQQVEATLIMPNNFWFGRGTLVNDLMCVGKPKDMGVYCSVAENLTSLLSQDSLFHPETLLARHLQNNQTSWQPGSWTINLRHLGILQHNNTYVSSFGVWN
jgi:hypothetical protein